MCPNHSHTYTMRGKYISDMSDLGGRSCSIVLFATAASAQNRGQGGKRPPKRCRNIWWNRKPPQTHFTRNALSVQFRKSCVWRICFSKNVQVKFQISFLRGFHWGLFGVTKWQWRKIHFFACFSKSPLFSPIWFFAFSKQFCSNRLLKCFYSHFAPRFTNCTLHYLNFWNHLPAHDRFAKSGKRPLPCSCPCFLSPVRPRVTGRTRYCSKADILRCWIPSFKKLCLPLLWREKSVNRRIIL